MERELTKDARGAVKKKQREAKEQRAHERQTRMVASTLQSITAQQEVRRLYKAN